MKETGGFNFSKVKNDKEPVVKLGFEIKDLSGVTQRVRGKQNVQYRNKEGEEFFTKYANLQKDRRDNIEGLKTEKLILDKLVDTGVTPQAGEIKIYPNKERARLIIEQLPGVSFDKMNNEQKEKFFKKEVEQTIYSTADALDKVHQKGILIVDVNDGTFLLDEKEGKIETRLVDFELALDTKEGSLEDRKGTFGWYLSKDKGLRLSKSLDHENNEILKKSEINLWARTLIERIISFRNVTSSVDLSKEKQVEFDSMKEKITPILESEIIKQAKKSYEYERRAKTEDQSEQLPNEDDFIKNDLGINLPRMIEEELVGISLEEKLKRDDIVLSKGVVSFLSRALSPDISKRPSNFAELKVLQKLDTLYQK
jgi:serine/threonine protein kinase